VSAAGGLLATGFGYDPQTHAGDLARLARVMPMARDVRRGGAASLDFAYVASGRLDGYFERGLAPWDHAAGALLVTEAGGSYTFVAADDNNPRPLTVASSPSIFERLLDIALDD
jgi:myo-inositol-1(or 4)-monophosphatase